MKLGRWLLGACFLLALACGSAEQARADDNETCFRESGDAAIEACDRVIESPRSNKDQLVDAHTNRGQEYYIKKNYKQAILDFDRAIQLNPRAILAHGNRANAKSMVEDTDAAIEDYTKAINLDRGYTAAYSGRTMEYEKKGQTSLAVADYKAALAMPQKYQDGKWAHDKARDRLKELGND